MIIDNSNNRTVWVSETWDHDPDFSDGCPSAPTVVNKEDINRSLEVSAIEYVGDVVERFNLTYSVERYRSAKKWMQCVATVVWLFAIAVMAVSAFRFLAGYPGGFPWFLLSICLFLGGFFLAKYALEDKEPVVESREFEVNNTYIPGTTITTFEAATSLMMLDNLVNNHDFMKLMCLSKYWSDKNVVAMIPGVVNKAIIEEYHCDDLMASIDEYESENMR